MKSFPLSQLCTKIGSGATPRGGNAAYTTEGTSLIRSQNVLDFTFSENGLAFINDAQAKALGNVEVQERDVLLNITGDSVARVCQVPKEVLPARVNQHVAILRASEDKLNPEFLKYSLLTPANKEKLLSLASTGATRNALTKGMLEQFTISVPDLPTQHRIASILSALDDKIELNRQMNQTLEQMAQTLFRQYFVEPLTLANQSENALRPSEHEKLPLGSLAAEEAFTPANREENGITLQAAKNLPSGWKIGTLEEIAEFSNGNAFSSKELLDCDTGECYHVFKMGHIKKGGGLNAEGTKSYFPKGIPKKLEKYVLKKGDLLMCMTDMKDNVALLGHTALMNEDDKYIVNQRVGLLRTNNSVGIGYPFLYLLTNSPEFLVDLRSRANSGVQVNLSTSEIKNTEVAIAPKEVNESFHNSVEPLFEKMFQILQENQTLTQTRDTLLPKLMSGEINVLQAAKTGAYEPEQVLS